MAIVRPSSLKVKRPNAAISCTEQETRDLIKGGATYNAAYVLPDNRDTTFNKIPYLQYLSQSQALK
jgi:hypothetical protein